MAEQILGTNVRVAVEGLDVSGRANELGVDYGQEANDNTVVNSSARSFYPGLSFHTFNYTAFFDADVETTAATSPNVDGTHFAEVGSSQGTLMVAPSGFTTGNIVYFTQSLLTDVGNPWQVGELMQQSAQWVSRGGPAVRGQSGFYSSAVTTATNGPVVSLGAVGSTQNLYVAWQVLNTTTAVAGILVSDTATTLPSSTTRATFTSLSTRGAEYAIVAGPITDTAYRFTITTTAGSAEVVAAFAIR